MQWGPDLITYSSGGSDRSIIPSGIIVALFASLGTWAVAKYGFGGSPRRAKTETANSDVIDLAPARGTFHYTLTPDG